MFALRAVSSSWIRLIPAKALWCHASIPGREAEGLSVDGLGQSVGALALKFGDKALLDRGMIPLRLQDARARPPRYAAGL